MTLTNRPFNPSSNDFQKLWHFLQQDHARRREQFIWHIGRLGDWKHGLWREEKYFPSFFRQNAHLWVDRFDQPLGFVINEDGGDTFFIFTHQDEALYAEILDWTVQHWGGRHAALKTEVHEFQAEALDVLERRGFRSTGNVAVTRVYDLRVKGAEPVHLPEGLRMVDMLAERDEYGKALLYADAYEGHSQVSEFEVLRSACSHENPAYDPYLDLSVVNAEGLHVAACVGFVDPLNRAAEVEKVCTHRQYRRQGLAEAVIRACFHRLYGRGIEIAYIQGYSGEANGLYEKLGASMRKQWYQFELPSGAVSGGVASDR
jgi:ribosomal protein S18 acetylase RimI-like enzyme